MTRSCKRQVARVRASARPRMRGAAVLFIVMLLLLSAGLLAYYAARVSLTEQRLSANDVLAHEAQSAAQAGLEAAFGALARLDMANPAFDADGGLAIDGPAATLSNGAAFTTRWHNQGLTPGGTAMLRIEARGIASDAIGMRVAHQLARRDPWLAQAPPAPLVARGAVTLGENGIIDSGAHPYAIWSGGGVSLPGSMTIEVGGAALCGFNGVCDEDERLAQLSAAAFMTNFFGRPPELMAAQSTTIACVSCAVDALAVVVRPAWIEGDAGVVTLAGGAAGAPDAPVILVVDGDLVIGADTAVHGVIHVRGDWLPGPGALTLHGAMTVTGSVHAPERVSLSYEPDILDWLASRGPYARIAGSWTDF